LADRVQAIKWESPSKGGTEFDTVPTEINPNEDSLDCRGIFVQDDESADSDVYVSRDDSGNLILKDKVVDEKTLNDLLESGYPRDYIPEGVTVTVPEHRQYIVYNRVVNDGTMKVDGLGVINGQMGL